MKFSFAALCLAAGAALATDPMPAMIAAMRVELSHIAQGMPGGVMCGTSNPGVNDHCLITTFADNADFRTATVNVNQVSQLASKWGLPADVHSKVEELVIASSVEFESFVVSVNANAGEGHVTEYIGAARNYNGKADVVVSHADITAKLHTQYDSYQERHCHHVLFWKRCHTETKYKVRGFTQGELENIQKAMRATAWSKLNGQVNAHAHDSIQLTSEALAPPAEVLAVEAAPDAVPMKPALAPLEPVKSAPSTWDDIKKSIAEMEKNFPQMKKIIDTPVQNEKVEEIVGRGFTVFQESVDMSKLDGVSYDNLNTLFGMLADQLDLPPKYSKQIVPILSTIRYEDSTTWVVFKLAFSEDTGGSCRDVVIMAHNNPTEKTTDWIVGNVKATFELAPNIIIMRSSKSYAGGIWGRSDDHIVTVPRSLDKTSLDTLFTFFDIINFKRAAELLGMQSGTEVALAAPQQLQQLSLGSLSGITGAITGITGAWQSIVNAFSTKISTKILQRIAGTGFSQIEESAEVQRIVGMQADFLKPFIAQCMDVYEIPSEYRSQAMFALEMIQYADEQDWLKWDMAFSQGKGGAVKYVAITGNKETAADGTTKYNFLVSNIEATFELAPDIVIIEKSASYAGGIFAKTEDIMKKIPRAVTQEDVEGVIDFFWLSAVGSMAKELGISFTWPKIPSKKSVALVAPQQLQQQLSLGSLSGITGAITGITGAWQSIVNAFSTKISTKILQRIAGTGFSQIEESAEVQRIVGMQADFLKPFIAQCMDVYEIPSEYRSQAMFALEMIQYADEQDWLKWDMAFSQGKGGAVKYVAITGNKETAADGTTKYNFLVSNIEATFELAPDIVIIEKSASYAGGIFAKTEDIMKKIPRAVTQEDVEGVIDFFWLSAVGSMAKELGISFTWPKIPSKAVSTTLRGTA